MATQIWVNTGSCNGLVPSDNKPLQWLGAIRPQANITWTNVVLSSRGFGGTCNCLRQISLKSTRYQFIKLVWTRQIWGIWKLRPAYSPETPNLGQNRWCFVPCDLEIWWMTLENNRAPLLCCFKLCTAFHSHRWIQTGVAVWKRPIWVKFDDF